MLSQQGIYEVIPLMTCQRIPRVVMVMGIYAVASRVFESICLIAWIVGDENFQN